MSEKPPTPASTRTQNRATALAWARGCFEWNPCWWECHEAALDAVINGELDEWERTQATPTRYWQYTHGVAPTPTQPPG